MGTTNCDVFNYSIKDLCDVIAAKIMSEHVTANMELDLIKQHIIGAVLSAHAATVFEKVTEQL